MSTLIIAHRGASAYTRENTMDAFQKAVEMGADAIEFDVRKTRDNVLIINHDPLIRIKKKEYLISCSQYRDLKNLLKLTEVLKRFSGQVKFNIELKETGYEEFVLETARNYADKNSLLFTSFYDSSVLALKKIDPLIKAGLLLGQGNPRNLIFTRISELFPWKRLNLCRADFMAANYKLFNPLTARIAASKKLPVFVWTVNNPHLMRRLCSLKVAGIITDKPDIALKIRNTLTALSQLPG